MVYKKRNSRLYDETAVKAGAFQLIAQARSISGHARKSSTTSYLAHSSIQPDLTRRLAMESIVPLIRAAFDIVYKCTPCHYRELEELEATRHAALEDAVRVVTPTHLLRPFSPLPSSKHVLPRMRIIEVYIARLHIIFSGSDVNVIDKRQGNGFDCGGVLRSLPGCR